MLAGQTLAECNDCYVMEKYGKVSGRQRQLLKTGITITDFAKSCTSSPFASEFEKSLQQGRTDRTDLARGNAPEVYGSDDQSGRHGRSRAVQKLARTRQPHPPRTIMHIRSVISPLHTPTAGGACLPCGTCSAAAAAPWMGMPPLPAAPMSHTRLTRASHCRHATTPTRRARGGASAYQVLGGSSRRRPPHQARRGRHLVPQVPRSHSQHVAGCQHGRGTRRRRLQYAP